MVACWHFGSQVRRSEQGATRRGGAGTPHGGDVALEDAHDLWLAATFKAAPFDVDACSSVRAHAGEHDAPQGVVGLPVAAAVEPVTDRLARRGVDRGDAAQVSPGGFGSDPVGVVPGGDEQQGGSVNADAGEVEQARCGRFDERGELVVKAAQSASMSSTRRPRVCIASLVAYITGSPFGFGRNAPASRARATTVTPRKRSRSSSGAQKPRWRSWLRRFVACHAPERYATISTWIASTLPSAVLATAAARPLRAARAASTASMLSHLP